MCVCVTGTPSWAGAGSRRPPLLGLLPVGGGITIWGLVAGGIPTWASASSRRHSYLG